MRNYKNRHRRGMRSIAMFVVCLFILNNVAFAEMYTPAESTLQAQTIFTRQGQEDAFLTMTSGYLGFYLLGIENDPRNSNITRIKHLAEEAVEDIRRQDGIPKILKEMISRVEIQQDETGVIIDLKGLRIRYFNHNLFEEETPDYAETSEDNSVVESYRGKYLTRQVISNKKPEISENPNQVDLERGIKAWINSSLGRPIATPLDWQTIEQFYKKFKDLNDEQNEMVNVLAKELKGQLALGRPRVLQEELSPQQHTTRKAVDAPPIITLALPNTLVLQMKVMEHEGDVQVIDSETMCAGTALGAAQELVALGRQVQLISLIGNGPVGKQFWEYIREIGFDNPTFIKTNKDTRLWPAIVREKDAHEWRFSAPGPSISLDEVKAIDEAASDAYDAADPETIVIMGGKIPPGLNASFWIDQVRKAREHNLRVFFDNLDMNRSSEELREILAAGVSLVKPNIKEFANLVGKDHKDLIDEPELIVKEARQLMHSVRSRGGVLKTIVISRGEKETILVTPNEAYMAAAPRIIPENHIGAGDTMIGALAHKLSLNSSLIEALKFTLAVSTISTQKPGIMRSATIEEAETMAADILVTPIKGSKDSEVWDIADLTSELFEFDPRAVEKVLQVFKASEDREQIKRDLLTIRGINRVSWDGEALTIVGNTEVVKFHISENEINERLGLKDRFYVKSDDLEKQITVKIYRRDQRDDRKVEGPVYVLGVGRNSHDSGAVLIKDGVIIGAIEEERLNMNKHTRAYFPINATRYLLNEHKITWDQISHIAVTYDYNWFRDTSHSKSPRDNFHEEMGLPGLSADKEKYDTNKLEVFLRNLADSYGTEYVPPVTFVKHHKSHAAAAWYTSGFPEPTLAVTIDGRGEDEATTVWLCADGKMKKISSNLYIHSLGHFYHVVTKYLGYKSHDEGKVMGFAPYGSPRNKQEEDRLKKLRALMNEVVSFDVQTGQIYLDQNSFNFFTLRDFSEMGFSEAFRQKLGEIVPEVPVGMTGRDLDPEKEEHRPYANLAYILQEKVEQCMLQMLEYYLYEHPETKGIEHVVMAGGLSLNIAANGKIIESGIVDADKFFVPAFPADDGTPVGAALAVADEEYALKTRNVVKKISLGKTYTDEEIESIFDKFGLVEGEDYFRVQDDASLIGMVADTLEENRTVAWFQGGAELGPRALGNRSILHRLDDPEGNLKVNHIKNREPWRPSALSIQQERASEFLEGIAVSPFMTIGFKVTQAKKDLIKAGAHPADGTTRPQTVSREANPLYWALLGEMGKRTGTPGVLNTSFNKWGPIVETPEDALNTFYYGDGIDQLAIGHFIVKRTQQLEPSVLNSRDEPSLGGIFNKARYNGSDAEIWGTFFSAVNDLAKARNIAHQKFIIVSIIDSDGKKEVLRIPLCKEMFQRGPREKMIPVLAEYIDGIIGKKPNPTILIETTATEYEDVVIGLFEQFTPSEIRDRWIIIKNLAEHKTPVNLQSKAKSKAWGTGSEKIGEYSWASGNDDSLVKLLTLGDSVAPQFHSDKDEVLIIAGVDPKIAGGQPKIMVGFSPESKKKYGDQVKGEYKIAIEEYADKLIALISILKKSGYEENMKELGKVVSAAKKVLENEDNKQIADALSLVEKTRKEVDFFYDYMDVEEGDVVIIPKNCLHAAGAGITIYEAQFRGSIISLDDMDKYPVRYSPENAPEWIRKEAKGILDWEKIPDIEDELTAYKLTPKNIDRTDGIRTEELGVHEGNQTRVVNKITLQKNVRKSISNNADSHVLHVLRGEAKVLFNGEVYHIPKVEPNGNALFIPANVKEYTIISISEDTQIIDTFEKQQYKNHKENVYSDTEYPNPILPLLDKDVFTFVRDILYDRYTMYGLDTSLVDDMMKYAIENRDDPENACDKIYKHVINFPSKNEETAFHSVYFGEYKNEVKPALLRDLIKGKVEGEVVLDAGAGMSALALSLLDENPGIKQFISTHNIDYKRVEISDPRMEFVPEETKDGFSIPIEDGVVDTVIVTGRLHHLYPGKESEFLREMVRVLHPQGKILIIEDAWADGLTDPERDEFARRFRGFADEQKQGVSAFLDWVGTRLMPGPELMARPWNFKSAEEWEESLFKPLGLEVKSREYHGFPDKKFTPLPQTTFELVKAGMLASNEKKWNKNRTVENATKKIIPQLIQSLIDMSENISAKDKKRKAAILLDTELADVSARNIKKEIEKLIDLLANVEGNNKHLLYFLENLEIVKGKGRELLSKKGNIKDEDIIVVTRSENMEYFEDQLNKKAIIAAIDRGNFPEDAYMPLLEVTLFAIGKYMGMEKEDLMKYYSKIPNATALQDLDSIDMDELSKGKYTGLFEEDMRSFVIKLIPDAVEFDEGELVDMMGIIRDVLSKA